MRYFVIVWYNLLTYVVILVTVRSVQNLSCEKTLDDKEEEEEEEAIVSVVTVNHIWAWYFTMHFLASVEYILFEGSCLENATRLCKVDLFTCKLVTWASNWCRRILNCSSWGTPRLRWNPLRLRWNPLTNLWVIIIRTGLHLVTIIKYHRGPLLQTETSLLFYLERCEHVPRVSSHCMHWEKSSCGKFKSIGRFKVKALGLSL